MVGQFVRLSYFMDRNGNGRDQEPILTKLIIEVDLLPTPQTYSEKNKISGLHSIR